MKNAAERQVYGAGGAFFAAAIKCLSYPTALKGALVDILTRIQLLKAALCGVAAVLMVLFALVDRGRLARWRRPLWGALVLLAVAAIPAYFDFGQYPKHGSFKNPHDHFHYFLGSKYSHEIGYFNLYRAVVVANTENNGRLMHKSLRDQHTYAHETAASVMADAAYYRGLFTPERWAEFKKDVAYFQRITIPRRWPGVVDDKGYNATPVWNLVAGLITNHLVSTDSEADMLFVLALDQVLLVIMLGAVWWAFGARTMLFVLIFFCLHYTMSFPHIRGAFLRMDWVTFLVVAICCLKRGHYGVAGGLMAYSALARIFPVLFVAGLGGKVLWDLSRGRVNPQYVRFFCVFVMVLCGLVGASIVYDGGLGHWRDFLTKISMHNDDLSPVRVGFKYLFLDTFSQAQGWTSFEREKVALYEANHGWWLAIQVLMLLATVVAARNVEPYEAVALGYVPVFFATAPTFYYHVVLLAPFFLFIPKLEVPARAAGAVFMVLACTLWYLLLQRWSILTTSLSYCISATLLVQCLYMLLVAHLTPAGAPAETLGLRETLRLFLPRRGRALSKKDVR
jgi:hypothetical protein